MKQKSIYVVFATQGPREICCDGGGCSSITGNTSIRGVRSKALSNRIGEIE